MLFQDLIARKIHQPRFLGYASWDADFNSAHYRISSWKEIFFTRTHIKENGVYRFIDFCGEIFSDADFNSAHYRISSWKKYSVYVPQYCLFFGTFYVRTHVSLKSILGTPIYIGCLIIACVQKVITSIFLDNKVGY